MVLDIPHRAAEIGVNFFDTSIAFVFRAATPDVQVPKHGPFSKSESQAAPNVVSQNCVPAEAYIEKENVIILLRSSTGNGRKSSGWMEQVWS